MTIKLHHWLALLILPALSGCYPEGAEYTDELDIVYTNYYDQFPFNSKQTYAIPDSVIKITGDNFEDPDGDNKPTFVPASYAVPILAQINQNMAANGWQRVNKNNNPDVVFLVSTMTTTNLYYYYDWYYWDWWYTGWAPWWGWYYPGYYPPVYVEGYRSGSVFMQIIDSKAAPQADNVSVVWSGIINGLAEGTTTDIVGRLQTGIDRAFAQSPYLKH